MTAKPSTPVEFLTAAIHHDRGMGHPWSVDCCNMERLDRSEALGLVDALAAVGAHIAPDVSIPASVAAGEPRTAASSIDNLGDRCFAVWQLVASQGDHGLTSSELNDLYDSVSRSAPGVYPPMKFDTPRKRLPELERAGHLVRTGRLRQGAVVYVASTVAEVAA